MIPPEDVADIERRLGAGVLEVVPVSGGCINEAFCLSLRGGGRAFVKFSTRAPAGVFVAEMAGLEWLRAGGGVNVPHVLSVSERWLVLEWIEPGGPAGGSHEALGRGLAEMHAAGAQQFGADGPPGVPAASWLAGLPLDNRPTETWAEFYAERRLRPMLRLCRDSGGLPDRLASGVEGVIRRMPEVAGPEEPPARLHGDLWGGNVLWDDRGRPWLVDPAAYGGHREVDLAMMRLFGGFPQSTFDAYEDVCPLAAGWEERVPLHQIFPLLVHVALFGASYLASLERALKSTPS